MIRNLIVATGLIAASGAAATEVALLSELASADPTGEASQILNLGLDNLIKEHGKSPQEVEKAFNDVYEHYAKEFDVDTYKQMMQELEVGLKNYKHSAAYTAYKTIPDQPQCDKGVLSPAAVSSLGVKAVTPFPGGMVKRLFGFDLGKFVFELSQKAAGPAGASGGMVPILTMQALSMGAGMIQSLVATAVQIVPRFVPHTMSTPFMPLSCMPMLTGHNCFGAVLHPITMSDFVIADVTDSMMDGYLSSFPTTYQQKVGRTSDVAYKLCGAAYMSMQCSSIFPRCMSPQAGEDTPSPVMGRAPMCFHMCISTLVMCPGFWIEDVLGPCQMVAAPFMCSMAVWWQFWRLPPQLVSFEEANPAPMECPKTDVGFSADNDYGLYDAASADNGPSASPFLEAAGEGESAGASGVVRLPNSF
jgi:hypothetical protein